MAVQKKRVWPSNTVPEWRHETILVFEGGGMRIALMITRWPSVKNKNSKDNNNNNIIMNI